MIEPSNESEVAHIFSMCHKFLGFERIIGLHTHYPDVTAIKDGSEVGVELEYKLSRFRSHIKIRQKDEERIIEGLRDFDKRRMIEYYTECVKEKYGVIIPKHVEESIIEQLAEEELERAKESGFPLFHTDLYMIELMKQTLIKNRKELCDVIVCWERDCILDCELDFEIIVLKELKEELEEKLGER